MVTTDVHASSPASNIQFFGQLVNAPCVVEMRSSNQVVVMGQVTDDELQVPGSWGDPTAFQIRLEDCDTSIRQTASVAFTGSPDNSDPQVFKTGYGRTPAKDVGLGIFDGKGNLLVPNSTPLSFEALNEGETVLRYTAKYRSTGQDVTPGDASVLVNFYVLYQ